VQGAPGWTPAAGMSVTAYIDGKICGQGATRQVGGQVVYALDVLADGWGSAAGCGEQGKEVAFYVDGRRMVRTAAWDNRQVWEVRLSPIVWLYLPLLRR
jgi:hypothetical protein